MYTADNPKVPYAILMTYKDYFNQLKCEKNLNVMSCCANNN